MKPLPARRVQPKLLHEYGCGGKKKKKIKDITLLFPDPLRFHQTSRADQAERHQFVCNNLKYAGTCYLRRSKLQLGQARLAVKSAFQG